MKNVEKDNSKDDKDKFNCKKSDTVVESDGTSDSISENASMGGTTSKKIKNSLNSGKTCKLKANGSEKKTSAESKRNDGDYTDDSDDDDKSKDNLIKNKMKKTVPTNKPETKIKLSSDRNHKNKNHMKLKIVNVSSDSDMASAKDTRHGKSKEASDSNDIESSAREKKQFTRSTSKKETSTSPENDFKVSTKGKNKDGGKIGQRASQRVLNKSGKDAFDDDDEEKFGKDKGNVKNSSGSKAEKECNNSSDSEEPLSRKMENKTEEMAEMREMFKKYISKLDINDEQLKKEQSKNKKKSYESSDSEDQNQKRGELKQETESESEELDKKLKKSTKKSKTESLEEKVQKIKKQKNIVDDKKVKNKKAEDKEELKEKEETIVSSSSQEPITRSVSVQTSRAEVTAEESQELVQKAERIAELEKELQVQLNASKMLEVELNKTRVILERMRSDHEDEISEINNKHVMNISEIKKKQWVSE